MRIRSEIAEIIKLRKINSKITYIFLFKRILFKRIKKRKIKMETNQSNHDILKILQNIELRLEKIEAILVSNTESCKKMDEHINFIDNVYDNVRKPFSRVLSYYHGETIQIEKKALKDHE